MILNRLLYAVFVGLLAFSPLLSLTLSDDLNWARFLWVGPALSLPVTLAVARLAGRDEYCAYWDYLESFPISSKATTIAAWGAVTVLAAAISFSSTV